MGQKVNPHGFRLGISQDWDSVWFASKDYSKRVLEDYKIRELLKKEVKSPIADIKILRSHDKLTINLYAEKPGLVIGKRGSEIEKLKGMLLKKLKIQDLTFNVSEVSDPDANAELLAKNIAFQIEKRASYKRVIKKYINSPVIKKKTKGILIRCAGRLNGSDIASSEKHKDRSLSMNTLKADVVRGFAEAHTKYGIIGITVYINKGVVNAAA